MATLRERIIQKLVFRVLRGVTATDVRDALFALGTSERNELLDAIRYGRIEQVGRRVIKAVIDHVVKPRAAAEADSMAADGQYTEADLDRILGQ